MPTKNSSLAQGKVISFDEENKNNVQDPHHDGLVIHFVHMILIDRGSSINIL